MKEKIKRFFKVLWSHYKVSLLSILVFIFFPLILAIPITWTKITAYALIILFGMQTECEGYKRGMRNQFKEDSKAIENMFGCYPGELLLYFEHNKEELNQLRSKINECRVGKIDLE